MRRAALALLLALLASAPADAHAFCRSTTCQGFDECAGDVPVPECPVLFWKSKCVGYAIHDAGGDTLDASTLELITELAFDAWRSVDCGGGARPGFVAAPLGRVSCGRVEYNQNAGNANVVFFNPAFEHELAEFTFALTTTTYETTSGELYNADIELNDSDYDFTVSDEEVGADLLSILTHEVGHFFGLGHSFVPDATMEPFYMVGETDIRALKPDDIAAICTLFPPGDGPPETCNPLPRHGFSPDCREAQSEGKCATARAGDGRASSLGWIAPAAALLLAVRLRARTAAPSRSRTRSA